MRRPSDLYNWYCVLHSVASITRCAANIRVEQLVSPINSRRPKHVPENNVFPRDNPSQKLASQHAIESDKYGYIPTLPKGKNKKTDKEAILQADELTLPEHRREIEKVDVSPNYLVSDLLGQNVERHSNDGIMANLHLPKSENFITEHSPLPKFEKPLTDLASSSTNNELPSPPPLKSSKVPSSRIGRLFHYGSLAASLSYGTASELLRKPSAKNTETNSSSLVMTEANLNRLVSKLSQMRGAALKIGQFMSIQDTQVLSEDLERIFRRVQDSAHYMPNWQMEKMMTSSLGPSWPSYFTSFNPIPTHAASIGQVHQAVLASSHSPTGRDEEVAVKIQFPNIVQSISSDLGYVKLLLGASAILPKGLFLNSTIKVFKEELADECDYRREASYIIKYGNLTSIKGDNRYRVPWVWSGSTEHVLVMERMKGVSIGGDVVNQLSQADRNEIATRILELCLRELFEFRMMQTDPNWSNFLWNSETHQIELIDFGATREYSEVFTDNWLELLRAAINGDRERCIEASLKLKYFIGGENESMVNAHITSMQLLGTPFRESTVQPFAFAKDSEWGRITEDIRAQIPIMLNNRLTPPPKETYSLNRKLSGAFLLAARLRASVDCLRVEKKMNILLTWLSTQQYELENAVDADQNENLYV